MPSSSAHAIITFGADLYFVLVYSVNGFFRLPPAAQQRNDDFQ